ncbi:MAG: porin, partial [Limnohabitans sp.]
RNNSQGTSQVTFKGVEDLGGGLKASFLLENDFDAGKDATGNFSSKGGEQYAALEGGFGKVALGAANTVSLFTQSNGNPFGTKIGSGFGAMNTGHVRNNNSIVYTSPVFAGFTLMGTYANQTKATAAVAAAATSGQYVQGAVNALASTDIGLLYANGPLSGGISAWTTAANDATNPVDVTFMSAASKNTQTNAYVSYDLGVAKISAGYYTEKQNATGVATGIGGIASKVQTVSTIDSQAYNVSAAVPLNASLSLLGNYAKKNDKTALNLDRTVAAIVLA